MVFEAKIMSNLLLTIYCLTCSHAQCIFDLTELGQPAGIRGCELGQNLWAAKTADWTESRDLQIRRIHGILSEVCGHSGRNAQRLQRVEISLFGKSLSEMALFVAELGDCFTFVVFNMSEHNNNNTNTEV